MPAPPYSSGNKTPVRPNAASFGCSSIGKCCASSHSITCGAISASANSRTLVLICCCSSFNSKCIPLLLFRQETRQRHSRLPHHRQECLSKPTFPSEL